MMRGGDASVVARGGERRRGRRRCALLLVAAVFACASLFGEVQPADRQWVDQLAGWIKALPPHEELFAPLTIGHHVDHQLTRLAAERTGSNRLRYYEDYPYAQQSGALEECLANESASWQSSTISLSAADLASKIEAILAFRSQFSTFWTVRTDLERQVRGYAQSVGGERIWRRATT